MLEFLKEKAEAAVASKVFPGCAIGIVQKGREPAFVAAGRHTYDPGSRAVSPSTVYDIASITKSIPTASLALVLSAEKKFSLDSRVREYLPELHNDFDATLRDLLLYRVSGLRLSELRGLDKEAMLAQIFEHGFSSAPGERQYTNLPALLLGLIIERVAGANLDILAHRYFFDPLSMKDTVFYAGSPLPFAAPTEVDSWRGSVSGETHDESAYILAKAGKVAGHAGVFSTAVDIAAFLTMLLDARDPRAHACLEGAQQGLGWQVNHEYFMGAHSSPELFGKTGFTGTSVIVSPERGIAFVILSNRTYPKRPADAASESSAINVFRRTIADMLLGDVH